MLKKILLLTQKNKHIIIILLIAFVTVLGCKKESEKADSNQQFDDQENSSNTTPLFSILNSSETGIDFINKNTESNNLNYYTYEYFYNGGGVAVADFNNDGLQDVYLTANMRPNRLYLNKGELQFQDITESANVNSSVADWCTGVTIVDINNDGWQDIFVSRSGWFKKDQSHLLRNLLYINNGDLTFTEKGEEYGFTDLSPTTQTCFFDADNDGDLDAYQINHPTKFKLYKENKDKTITKLDLKEHDFSDKFYINSNGKFIDKTKEMGFKNSGHGLGVLSEDFNNDGWQDLYVANDYSEPDYLYINQKNGLFKNEALTAFKHISKFSMGLDAADINNDGYIDVFNAEMLAKDNYAKKANMASMNPKSYWFYVDNGLHYQDMHNSLQLNNGNGTFSEISWLAGVAESNWSWSPLIADFDNDGYKDLFVSNGYKRDMLSKDHSKKVKEIIQQNGGSMPFLEFEEAIPQSKVSNYVFKNNGNLTFSDMTAKWGIDQPVNSNGAAYADFDNDGDLDIIINNIEENAFIYKNNSDYKNNYIALDINAKGSKYGTQIEILDNNNYQKTTITNTRGFQSSSDTRVFLGLGKKTNVDSLLITWPNGKQSFFKDLKANQLLTINYENFTDVIKKENEVSHLFKDVTKELNINHKHEENEFDDYINELLLPHKLSQDGPFIDVADVNNDGLEDFYVGNGVGFAGKLYVQTKNGRFNTTNSGIFEKDKQSEDLGVLFFDYDNDGDQDLYVVSGSNEHSLSSPYMQDRIYKNDGHGQFTKTKNILPKMQASGSCVKAADYDNDGDLDLFIGGYQIPQEYPKSGISYLLQNDNGVFKDVTEILADGLKSIGMVKDAQFADINSDGDIDLIVAGHWMPLEVFINVDNTFVNKTKEFGLEKEKGWWNTLEVFDLNQDGYLDIIAGNLGANSKHKASYQEPFKIFAKDFDNNGKNDIVLGYYDQGTLYPVRGKQCSSEQLPDLNNKIKSYNEFASLELSQIYGESNLEDANYKYTTNFLTSKFINQKGNKFTIEALKNQAQFAPTNAIINLDVNKDEYSDLILAGNMHPVEVETGRYDAHTGNILINTNSSNKSDFKYLTSKNTDLFIDSDVRSFGLIKIQNKNHLIVASNRDNLQIFELPK